MQENSSSVQFLYKTVPGRAILKAILVCHLDKPFAALLRTPLSKPYIARFVKNHGIELSDAEVKSFRTFQEFFSRFRENVNIDLTPEHLISPCDGWLSVYPIQEDSRLLVKGAQYSFRDLFQTSRLTERFQGGTCLIFRLCPTDYHRYIYIDNGKQGENHYIKGKLHSVQPIACETVPVYHLNRRTWCLMETERFGSVIQMEVGALVVGGIVNNDENCRFLKGMEKGRFELRGSTIMLLFQKDTVSLLPEIEKALSKEPEVRVEQGMQIGTTVKAPVGMDT